MTDASRTINGSVDTCKWEVMMVATAPHCQGRGFASQLLNAAIDRIRKAQDGESAVVGLTTQLHRNVLLYSKLGFKVTDERVVLDGTPDAFRSWTMRLDLTPKQAS
jgi:ribosomal protein S18 acetylase RimI-like enzyme